LKTLIPASTMLLTELRLEISFGEPSDVKLLTEMLVLTKSLKRMAIDFIGTNNKTLQDIPLDVFSSLRDLKTFGFRIPTTGIEEVISSNSGFKFNWAQHYWV